ncbi:MULTISPECIES: NAD(P)H-dependent oxidoreductase [Pseudomonas]|uniref:NAD(P)H-dependent oxidoreductase n=1 Tax=Pseudomonas TaxID=286 RepID=UPI000876C49C|nr:MULTISPECIES: NAD(P)H-dependent oxidoreductase [Pseudomonas]MDT8905460.1 NAD(P)H-dependent oxidoreductase [Pseudomonas prosekii]ROO34011.1 NAD(P)H dehydrogenase [Pseudomonas sp. 7SR1]ROO42830.1 NAD(P)H dehydrogenase [Pseudomonas sp. AF76]SCX66663.1 NAD(P)H dehydrogenase (quinone) [Pseudomonas sp. NFACC32-1]SFW46603.1 NAD(P)H dehydrogenase (quinone) [Pseudomonas sp. NFACC09-4]
MHALIVVAHHDPHSLTHGLAAKIAEGITLAHDTDTFEIADLAAEGFDPRFGFADHAVHHREALPPADVLAEQARIDRADALVLVYPIYWWSMPALLKGWIDRVFSNGWAFDFSLDKPFVKKLQRLKVHLVAVGGADADSFRRHGYDEAMTVQIDHGIFDYCGARVISSQRLLESETLDPAAHLEAAQALGQRLFARSGETAREQADAECA